MMHTPGPWEVAAPEKGSSFQVGDRLIHTKDGRHLAETFQYQNDEHPDEMSESTANAHLIAASPDLLKAAKEVTQKLDEYLSAIGPYYPSYFKRVEKSMNACQQLLEAAIAKAEK